MFYKGDMKLYLIRHAESIANTKGIYQGQTHDTDLSPLGKRQAEALKRRLKDKKIEALYSSPALRCLQTIRSLSEIKGLEITTHKNLLEINHGDWEGKTKEEIEKLYPRQLKIWRETPSRIQMPTGENLLEVKKRVEKSLKDIKQKNPDKSVLICSHDAVLRTILAPLLRFPLDNIWEIPLEGAAVTEISLIEERIIVLNDTEHLRGLRSDITRHAL